MFGRIYKITNLLSGKMYIGQTIRSLKTRRQEHILGKRSVISHAISRHGVDNFSFEEIELCVSQEHLNEREIYWIETLGTDQKEIGYNIKAGGNAGRQPAHIRQLVADKLRGRKAPQHVVQILKDRHGEKNPNYGNHFSHTTEARQKMSKNKLRRLPAENKNAKRVICTETQVIYPCITDAAIAIGVKKSALSNHLTGRAASCKGMHFQYIPGYGAAK